jgi:hypothetical protein
MGPRNPWITPNLYLRARTHPPNNTLFQELKVVCNWLPSVGGICTEGSINQTPSWKNTLLSVLAHKLSGYWMSLHACLARSAWLKILRSLKPKPPITFLLREVIPCYPSCLSFPIFHTPPKFPSSSGQLITYSHSPSGSLKILIV